MKKKTSFGTLEVLLERDNRIVSEFLTFEREGRGHVHNEWEICYVIEGDGIIVSGEDEIAVRKGDVCKIPPKTNHWMIPNDKLEILIVYSKSSLE
ncbi:MAG: cupin domain-containing protein [Flavobacteriales bacterium]|nr:cupin domain-containing protein [Flavobacteriales bacterium]